jgi:hypothetical protein
MSLIQIALIGFFVTTGLRAFNLSVVLSVITYDYLRVDNSHTSIKNISRSASLWEKTTGLCFWNMKSSMKQQVRMSICIRIVAVAAWFAFLLIAIACAISEQFRPLLVFMLKFTVLFDGGLISFGTLYIMWLEPKLKKQKRKK